MRKSLGILLIFLIFSACSGDDRKECIGYENVPVLEVAGPSTMPVEGTASFQVDFQVFNGCGRFHKFVESETGFTRIIKVEARYEGCICTANLPVLTATYEFTPQSPGEYELHFQTINGDFITKEILVE